VGRPGWCIAPVAGQWNSLLWESEQGKRRSGERDSPANSLGELPGTLRGYFRLLVTVSMMPITTPCRNEKRIFIDIPPELSGACTGQEVPD
jgi:hypothetical protein